LSEEIQKKNQEVGRMTAKEKNTEKLLIYLSDPNNEWLTKEKLSTEVLGMKDSVYVNKMWSPAEFDFEIAGPALEARRGRMARYSMKIDRTLVDKALEGDVQAIKLYYQRLENWTPAKKTELVGKIDGQLTLADVLNGTVDEA
jgi:hypothetical protein